MAAATSARPVRLFDRVVREIIVRDGWRERLQDLVPRRQQAWPLLALVAGAAVVALLLGGRSSSARVAPPARPTSPAVPASTPGAPASQPAGAIYVHVAGAVRRPGLYEFPDGARVADAVESAGGPARGADLDALNLAELLVDGAKVEVVRVGEPAPVSVPSASGAPVPGLIPLNTADQAALETIPGIGPVTALAILNHRHEIGSFESIEQLLDVDGIGPATFESIRSYLTV